jgi:putative sterol carrier protein
MTIEDLREGFRQRAGSAEPLGKSIKFKFDEGVIFLDGSGEKNVVSDEDRDADCTISMSLKNFDKLRKGDLNPMTAFMMGKIKVKGDMSLAMKLKDLL